LALSFFVAGAVPFAVTYAITEEKHRILALSMSTFLCVALLLGLGIYDLIAPSPARTANLVVSEDIKLSAEAGASPAIEPLYDINGNQEGFDRGNVEIATCYSMVGASIWLYLPYPAGVGGFAPFSSFHYQKGFPAQLPSPC
jgi:hypothetical protein